VNGVAIDRPSDGLLTRRLEFVSGTYGDPEGGEFALTANCGGRDLLLRPCLPAPEVRRSGARGFWTPLRLQDWLDVVRGGGLHLEFAWRGRPAGTADLLVSPIAMEVATRFPIASERFDVPRARPAREPTLVFPGLGAVGGTSLNELMRTEAHRRGWGVPVHHEADHAESWARYDLAAHAPMRWVDGHHCWNAGDRLPGRCERITLLREPVRRLASVFNYGSLVHPDSFPFRTFEAFLASGCARRHSQAEALLRLSGMEDPERLSDPDLAAAASDELERSYAFVGITERFEESIFYICRLAGIDSVGVWTAALSAPRQADPGRVPGSLATALAAAVAADEAVYHRAAAVFERRLAEVDFGASLDGYVRAAAAAPELSDVHKTVECLRWRQVLTDAAIAMQTPSKEAA